MRSLKVNTDPTFGSIGTNPEMGAKLEMDLGARGRLQTGDAETPVTC